MSPPSSIGMSLLLPAPETWEPYSAVEPGNFWVTEESTPDSMAEEKVVSKRNLQEEKSGAGFHGHAYAMGCETYLSHWHFFEHSQSCFDSCSYHARPA